MATSVQSIQTTSPLLFASNPVARESGDQGSFADTMMAALQPEAATPPVAGVRIFEIDEDLTADSLAAILAQILAGQPQIPDEIWNQAAVPEAKPPEPEDETLPADDESGDVPRTDQSSLLALLNIVIVDEPKAMRFKLPSPLEPGEAKPLPIQFRAPVAKEALEQEAAATKGKLVFQLALEVPAAIPDKAARPLSATERAPIDRKGPAQSETALPDARASEPAARIPEQVEPIKAMAPASPATERPPVPLPEPARSWVALPQSSLTAEPPGHTPTHFEPAALRPAAARSAEIIAPQLPQSMTPLLQKIGIVVHGTDQSVRLDIRQNGDSVRVAVHSDDPALAARLQDSLPELLNHLGDRGLQARVTSVLNPSNQNPLARPDSGNSTGQNAGGWSQNQTREQQQRQRNPQRYRQLTAWELQEG